MDYLFELRMKSQLITNKVLNINPPDTDDMRYFLSYESPLKSLKRKQHSRLKKRRITKQKYIKKTIIPVPVPVPVSIKKYVIPIFSLRLSNNFNILENTDNI